MYDSVDSCAVALMSLTRSGPVKPRVLHLYSEEDGTSKSRNMRVISKNNGNDPNLPHVCCEHKRDSEDCRYWETKEKCEAESQIFMRLKMTERLHSLFVFNGRSPPADSEGDVTLKFTDSGDPEYSEEARMLLPEQVMEIAWTWNNLKQRHWNWDLKKRHENRKKGSWKDLRKFETWLSANYQGLAWKTPVFDVKASCAETMVRYERRYIAALENQNCRVGSLVVRSATIPLGTFVRLERSQLEIRNAAEKAVLEAEDAGFSGCVSRSRCLREIIAKEKANTFPKTSRVGILKKWGPTCAVVHFKEHTEAAKMDEEEEEGLQGPQEAIPATVSAGVPAVVPAQDDAAQRSFEQMVRDERHFDFVEEPEQVKPLHGLAFLDSTVSDPHGIFRKLQLDRTQAVLAFLRCGWNPQKRRRLEKLHECRKPADGAEFTWQCPNPERGYGVPEEVMPSRFIRSIAKHDADLNQIGWPVLLWQGFEDGEPSYYYRLLQDAKYLEVKPPRKGAGFLNPEMKSLPKPLRKHLLRECIYVPPFLIEEQNEWDNNIRKAFFEEAGGNFPHDVTKRYLGTG